MIKNFEHTFNEIQRKIIDSFKNYETSKKAIIHDEVWKRNEGGGGRTYVIENGNFFDNCAVNFSSIYGNQLPVTALNIINPEIQGKPFHAMGVSVISHPKNPYIPSSHMNVRLFCSLSKKDDIASWWTGGGYDLSPFFIEDKFCQSWHQSSKDFLDKYDSKLYKEFSSNCNDYFFIRHRKERRGVGGIFFDNFKLGSIDESLGFLASIASQYEKSYSNIILSNKDKPFTEDEKEFQEIRRGRYAEFNLVYDRGTSFGLQSNGRTESILASIPSNCRWTYKLPSKFRSMEKNLIEKLEKNWNEKVT